MKNWRDQSDETLREAFAHVDNQLVQLVAYVAWSSVPCDHFRPEWRKLADQAAMAMRCHLVEVTENPSACTMGGANVEAVPTTQLWQGNVLLFQYEGPYTAEALWERIRAKLKGAV